MKWTPSALTPMAIVAAAIAPVAAHAAVHVSIEQSQRDIFGASALTPHPIALTPAQQDKLREVSSVSAPFMGDRIWKTDDGGWYVVDEVVGKHEAITYAVGINADGTIRRVEILEYRESYGYEVAGDGWLGQFVGKRDGASFKLGNDIQNISGATLSSKHVADGVKRVMAMHASLLQGR
jgi:hypothetical protein